VKTAEQEKLQGFPGHRPKKANIPVPDQNIPDPPKWMGRIGKRAFYDLKEVVGNTGMRVMARSDRLALVMVAEAFEEYRECKKEIEKTGRYWLDAKGVSKKNSAIVDMQNAWGRVMSGLSKFGMTPYDRQKVTVLSPEKKEKTREELMTEKREKALASAQKRYHLKAVNES